MIMHNLYIGENATDVTMPFVGGDSEIQFVNNSKKMSADWYYHKTPITYTINNNGHRSSDIKDIDLENYILVTGCSHTYGVGLELENTYPYKLAAALKCSYYNIAMPATGIDVMEYNLLMWMSKVKQKPKFVVIQMPDHSRYCNHNPYISKDFLIEGGSWATDPEEQKMVINCEDTGFFYARKLLTYKNIKRVLDGVPTLYFNVYGQKNTQTNAIKMRKLDLARDLSHFGILSNNRLSVDIYDYIKREYPTLTPD